MREPAADTSVKSMSATKLTLAAVNAEIALRSHSAVVTSRCSVCLQIRHCIFTALPDVCIAC